MKSLYEHLPITECLTFNVVEFTNYINEQIQLYYGMHVHQSILL